MSRYWIYIYLTFLIPSIAEAGTALNDKHEAHVPILFVHGHGLYPKDWDYLTNYFIGRSYPPEYLYALKIEPNTERNKIAAQDHIGPAVDRLLRVTGSKKVNIVSHSMGAVSSRWYASKIAPEKVNAWISIAGSNHGTNALCKYSDVAAMEMCPAYSNDSVKNTIQTELNGDSPGKVDETPFGFGIDTKGVNRIAPNITRGIYYWTIRIAVDEWILPSESAILDGAGGIPLNDELPSYLAETSPGNYLFEDKSFFNKRPDHCSLLRNDKVAKLLFELIRNANMQLSP